MRERFKMATSIEEENLGQNETKIPCGSKRSLDTANQLIFSSVDDIIGKNTIWSDDQKERLRRRFHEVYETAIHENIEFDGQTWADVEAHEDGESTQEFEAINLERQNQVQEMAGDLDTLLVDTTTKRSQYPRKITQKVAQRLQCQHEAVGNYKPILVASITESSSQDIVSKEDGDAITARLTSTGKGIAALTKELPLLEDKAARLHQAVEMQNATSSTKTHNVISRPHPEENKMAASMSPLKRRLDETPSPVDDKISKGQMPKKELRDHPIKRYKLETPTTS